MIYTVTSLLRYQLFSENPQSVRETVHVRLYVVSGCAGLRLAVTRRHPEEFHDVATRVRDVPTEFVVLSVNNAEPGRYHFLLQLVVVGQQGAESLTQQHEAGRHRIDAVGNDDHTPIVHVLCHQLLKQSFSVCGGYVY